MASRQETVDYILEQIGKGATARKMFGEYAIYFEGKMPALVCDDELFVKPTEAGKKLIKTIVEDAPYPGAKPHLLIAGDLIEDSAWLAKLIRATAAALPQPKPKKPKAKTPKAKKT